MHIYINVYESMSIRTHVYVQHTYIRIPADMLRAYVTRIFTYIYVYICIYIYIYIYVYEPFV